MIKENFIFRGFSDLTGEKPSQKKPVYSRQNIFAYASWL
ncbi:hypothetical protein FLA_2194 [Filimonas lacunae]|nr:hypothetical protein FLA_2194 [Filimonas lacunae]